MTRKKQRKSTRKTNKQSNSNYQLNRKHKDQLFRLIFNNRPDLLDLYNAVNHTDYSDVDALEVNTIDNVIYIGMKNDLSFIVGGMLNLYEHQSTSCGNLPLRGFFYIKSLYQQYVKVTKANLYGPRTIKLPFPQYVVFFNGCKEEPDEWYEKLSDSFIIPEHKDIAKSIIPALECRVRVLNINYGHNKKLMERCRALSEYAIFVSKLRRCLTEEADPKCAANKAVDECIKEGVLVKILEKNRGEVVDVILTEYDEELTKKMWLEHYREQHIKEGHDIGLAKGHDIGLAKGHDIGLAKGALQTAQSMLLDILTELGTVSDELCNKISMQQDLNTLRLWAKFAMNAKDIEAFTLHIDQLQ